MVANRAQNFLKKTAKIKDFGMLQRVIFCNLADAVFANLGENINAYFLRLE